MNYGVVSKYTNDYSQKKERASMNPYPGFGYTSPDDSRVNSSTPYSNSSYGNKYGSNYNYNKHVEQLYERMKIHKYTAPGQSISDMNSFQTDESYTAPIQSISDMNPFKTDAPYRSGLDRIADALSIGGYATIGAIKGVYKKDLGVVEGFVGGLKAGNPFGNGFEEGEHTFTSVLDDAGWQPETTLGKVARGIVGFTGDVLLDPLTYFSGGASAVTKGSGKVTGKAVGEGLEAATKGLSKVAAKEALEKFGKEASEQAVNHYVKKVNKLGGIVETGGKGLEYGIGKYKKTVISDDMLRLFGDKTIAPHLNKLKDYLIKNETFSLIDFKSDLKKIANMDPKEAVDILIYSDIRNRNSRTLSKITAKTTTDIQKSFSDLDLDQRESVAKLLEDEKMWIKRMRSQGIQSSDEGRDLITRWSEERSFFKKTIKNYDDLIAKKNAAIKELNSIDAVAPKLELAELLAKRKDVAKTSRLIEVNQNTIKKALADMDLHAPASERPKKIGGELFTDTKDLTGTGVTTRKAPNGWNVIKGKDGIGTHIAKYSEDGTRTVHEVSWLKQHTLGDLAGEYKYTPQQKSAEYIAKLKADDLKVRRGNLLTENTNKYKESISSKIDELDASIPALEKSIKTKQLELEKLLKDSEGYSKLVGENKLPLRKAGDKTGKEVSVKGTNSLLESDIKAIKLELQMDMEDLAQAKKSVSDLNSKYDLPSNSDIEEFSISKGYQVPSELSEVDTLPGMMYTPQARVGSRKYGTSKKAVAKFVSQNKSKNELYNKAIELINQVPFIKDEFAEIGFNKALSKKELEKFILTFHDSDPLTFVNNSFKYMEGYELANVVATFKVGNPGKISPDRLVELLNGSLDSELASKFVNEAKDSKSQIAERLKMTRELIENPERAFEEYKVLVDDIHNASIGNYSDVKTISELQKKIDSTKLQIKVGDPKFEVGLQYELDALNEAMAKRISFLEKTYGNANKMNELGKKSLYESSDAKSFLEDIENAIKSDFDVSKPLKGLEFKPPFEGEIIDDLNEFVFDVEAKKIEIFEANARNPLPQSNVQVPKPGTKQYTRENGLYMGRLEDAVKDRTLTGSKLEAFETGATYSYGNILDGVILSDVQKRELFKIADRYGIGSYEHIYMISAMKRLANKGAYAFTKQEQILLNVVAEQYGHMSPDYVKVLRALGDETGNEAYEDLIKLPKEKASLPNGKEFGELPKTKVESLGINPTIKGEYNPEKAVGQLKQNEARLIGIAYNNYFTREKAVFLDEYLKLDAQGIAKTVTELNEDAVKEFKLTQMKRYFPHKSLGELSPANRKVIDDLTLEAKKAKIIPNVELKDFYNEFLERSEVKIKDYDAVYEAIQKNAEMVKDGYYVHSSQLKQKIAKYDELLNDPAERAVLGKAYERVAELDLAFTGTRIDNYARQVLGEHYDKYVYHKQLPGSEFLEPMHKMGDYQPEVIEKAIEVRKLLNDMVSEEAIDGRVAYLPHKVKDKYKSLVSGVHLIPNDAILGIDGKPFITNSLSRTLKGSIDDYKNSWVKSMVDRKPMRGSNGKILPYDLFDDDIVSILTERAIKHDNFIYDKTNSKKAFDLITEPWDIKRKLKPSEKIVVRMNELTSTLKIKGRPITVPELKEFMAEKGVKVNFHKSSPFVEIERGAANLTELRGIHMKVMKGDTFNHFNRLSEYQISDGFRGVLDMYDKVLNLWKLNVTVLFPSFHEINVAGNMFNNYLDIGAKAFNPLERKRVYDIMHNKYTKNIVTELGEEITPEELRRMAEYFKVVDTGYFGEMGRTLKDVAEKTAKGSKARNGKFNPFNANEFVPYKVGRAIGSEVENQDKMINFLHHIEKGLHPAEAADLTNKFLFDYGNATVFEKEVMRRAVPFWTWAKKNIPLQAEQLINSPEKFRPFTKGIKAIDESNDYDENYDFEKPDWASDWMRLPTKPGARARMMNPNLPFMDLGSDANDILSKLSPFIKLPLELASGKNFYTGKDLGSEFRHISRQVGPVSAIANVINKKGEDKVLEIAAHLTGVKTLAYKQERYSYKKTLNDAMTQSGSYGGR